MKLMDKLFGQRARTKEKFIDLAIKSWHDSGGKPLYDYSKINFKGMGEPITVNCPKKGHGPFDVSKASNHLNYKGRPGQGCPKCKCEASTQNFIEKAQAIHGDLYGYDKVDYCNPKYQRRDTNTGTPKWYFPIYCKKHQRYFEQRSDIHLGDHGCPACAESKGEAELKNYFAKKGVKIDIGNFENCTNKKTGKACRRLPFDVYSPDLNVIVEFDGKQHFQDVPYFFKDKEGYKDQVRRDKLKNDFCKEEGNPKLIRISYMTPFNQISSVLDTLLKKAKTSNDKIILASDYPKAGWNA
jgi:very-short-patch-repair endonuclease